MLFCSVINIQIKTTGNARLGMNIYCCVGIMIMLSYINLSCCLYWFACIVIKSPQYTGGDFMFLYRFVRRRRCLRCRHRPQILVHAITLDNFLDFFHFWHNCWRWPIDYLIRFWSIFVVTLTLNFQGQIWNLLYLSQKWSDCHETKYKHIDWTLGLKCDHRFWPWPWPWPWIFKVKCGIRYISVKNGPIATRRKANILIDLKTSNVIIGFDLGHDLDPEFSRSNMELAISLPKMVRLPQNEKQTHRLNSWPQMWPSDLTLAVTLTLNFQGEIWIFIYLNQNWPDCHETKSKHIDLNSRPQIWPMGLTLAMTLIFEFEGHMWSWPFGDQGQV